MIINEEYIEVIEIIDSLLEKKDVKDAKTLNLYKSICLIATDELDYGIEILADSLNKETLVEILLAYLDKDNIYA